MDALIPSSSWLSEFFSGVDLRFRRGTAKARLSTRGLLGILGKCAQLYGSVPSLIKGKRVEETILLRVTDGCGTLSVLLAGQKNKKKKQSLVKDNRVMPLLENGHGKDLTEAVRTGGVYS